MQLKVANGQLTLGSAFKLFAVGWMLSFGLLFGVVFLAFAAGSILSGHTVVNGQPIAGRGSVFLAMLPFILLPPIAIPLQAVTFAGLVTGGLALYRLRRPITVAGDGPASPGA